MKTLKIKKGTGTIIGNLLRQIALTQLPAVKIIAFSVGGNSTVVSAGDHVLEDMVEFGNNLSSYIYDMDEDYKEVSLIVADGILKISDLEMYGIRVMKSDSTLSGELLHTSQQKQVTLYFKKGLNVSFADDNRYFLTYHGVSPDNLVVVNTRFNNIKSFTFNVEQIEDASAKNEDFELLHLSVESLTNESEEELLNKINKALDEVLVDFRAQKYV